MTDTIIELPYQGRSVKGHFKDIQECVEKGYIHKLMVILKKLPPPNYKDNLYMRGAIVSNPKNKDVAKLLQVYCVKGLKKAEQHYETHYQHLPPDNIPSDSAIHPEYANVGPSTSILHTRAQNKYITPLEQMLIHDTSKKATNFDDEIIYEEIKHIGEKREKEQVPGVSQLEETTEEIKKGVQHANVTIENSFSDLQNMIKQMTRKTTSTVETMEMQMSQLEQAVIAVQSEMKKNTEAINTGVNQLLDDTDNLRFKVGQSAEFNEYVYYRVFTVVARAVGNEKGKWEELFGLLLEGYPEMFVRKIIWEIQMEHPSEVDMMYDCLTRWKLYNSSTTGKDRLPTLTKALSKLGFRYIVKDINDILKKYNQDTEERVSATLNDEILTELGKNIGNEYITVGNFLDISPAKLTKLQEEQDPAVRNYTMLTEWRSKQQGYTSTSLAKLTGALKHSERNDLVETLARSVESHITPPPKTESLYDMYLTPVQILQE